MVNRSVGVAGGGMRGVGRWRRGRKVAEWGVVQEKEWRRQRDRHRHKGER